MAPLGRQVELAKVIETIIGATGSTEALLDSSLQAGQVIPSRAVFSFRFGQDGGEGVGRVSDTGLLGDDFLPRLWGNYRTCPVEGWHRDGNGEEIGVLSAITDPDDYRRSGHYAAVFGEVAVGDLLSIPMGSDGDVARVVFCRDDGNFDDDDVETAQILQPVLTGCLRQSRVIERLRTDPLSEEAMREHGLTSREAQIFHRLAAGATSQSVGQELGISVRTVEKHVQNIYARIGARNRSEAISILLGNNGVASVAAAVAALLPGLVGLGVV